MAAFREREGRDNKDRGDRGDRGERGGRGSDDGEKGGFRGGGRRGKARPAVDLTFDYKDPDTLRQFITEHGKIIPSRVSRLSAKQQRSLKTHIKRARTLALMPVGTKHVNYEEFSSRPRFDRSERGGFDRGGDRPERAPRE